MGTELSLVTSADEIRTSMYGFAAQASQHAETVRSLLTGTRYWVFDPVSGSFGPSKFVGLGRMTLPRYEAARKDLHVGASFDGNRTRLAIEKCLNARFQPDEAMMAALGEWAKSLLCSRGVDPLAGIDRTKWAFVSLPEPESMCRTEYVTSWKYDTFESMARGTPIEHAGSSHFNRL
ncbi:hypothetical protein [Paludibaculum fermentans]|uniref:hypothetical protein n=1 Tax=Paludibaculum fermentans TaxID=1473598 RepID=UPI003EB8F467